MTSLAEDIKSFKGIKCHRHNPLLSHLFFADDAMFFFHVREADCSSLKSVLDRFCSVSGQVINLQKSLIKFSHNVPIDMQHQIKSIFNMNAQDSIGRYLGTQVEVSPSKIQHFTPLLDLLSSKIGQCRARNLSQAAKLIIINSFLVASLVHHISVFKIPSTIANKMDRILARFFWTTGQATGIHWRKKSILHRPKGFGGLGIRSIGALNQALLMKQVWRIQNNPQLLLSQMYSRFKLNTTQTSSWRGCASWAARGLIKASHTLLSQSVWKVGDGAQIRVTSDKWLNGTTPVLRDHVSLREAASLSVTGLINSTTKQWDCRQIHRLFTPNRARQILELELPLVSPTADCRKWPLTKSGEYSTKTGYFIALQHQQNEIYSMTDDQDRFFRTLWRLNIMPKWKLFLWKL